MFLLIKILYDDISVRGHFNTSHVSINQKIRPQLYVPTDDDIKKVMEAAKGTEMEIPILLAAFGPMRRGEICALDRSDIAGTRVHVHRNMVLDENRKYIIKSPKSYAGDRFIDFPSFITDQIPKGNGRVTELNPNMITQRFNHVLKHAGVPHFRFHDCRHCPLANFNTSHVSINRCLYYGARRLGE